MFRQHLGILKNNNDFKYLCVCVYGERLPSIDDTLEWV